MVELLVVIGVVALLLSLILPGLRGAKASAGETVSMSNLRQVHGAYEAYAQVHHEAYPWAPAGAVLLVSAPGEAPSYIQGAYWDLRWYWTALMHEVAPWPEHFASWVGPGGVQGGDRPWRRSNAPGEGVPSYQVSDTFFARPKLWSVGTIEDPSLYRPVRCSDVLFPSSKVLAWDWEMTHVRAADADRDPTPMVFADAHARVNRVSRAARPPVIAFKPDTRPLQDTPDGVHGRDY